MLHYTQLKIFLSCHCDLVIQSEVYFFSNRLSIVREKEIPQ